MAALLAVAALLCVHGVKLAAATRLCRRGARLPVGRHDGALFRSGFYLRGRLFYALILCFKTVAIACRRKCCGLMNPKHRIRRLGMGNLELPIPKHLYTLHK